MTRTIRPYILLAIASSLTLWSCGGETANEKEIAAEQTDTTTIDEVAAFQFSYTIGSLPSPLTIFDEITKSNLEVDTRLLNPVSNVVKYTSPVKQALNYGIYGVDLAYLVINEKNSEIYPYYSAAKDLSDEIGIGDLFEKFSSRFKEAKEERDTLARVVDEAYAATDTYLRSNERLETASMILAGSWLECQFILTSQLRKETKNPQNEKLFSRVWEQQVYLDNITKALSEFAGNKDLTEINKQFGELLNMYKELPEVDKIDATQLNKLNEKISSLRNMIIG